MRYLLCVAAVTVLMSSCKTKTDENAVKAPVTYETRTVEEYSPNCNGATDTTACARYSIRYPVFHGLDSTAAGIIQQRIDSAITLGYNEGKLQTIAENAKVFVAQYESFKKESPDMAMGWTFDGTIDVQLLTDTLISMAVSTNDFTGGAHPNANLVFINVRPDGRKVLLDEILKPGYSQALTAAGEKVFREVREIADNESYSEKFFEFENDVFRLPDNYGFTREGIRFYFNSYDIAPYAAGPTEIFIPYLGIQDWLK